MASMSLVVANKLNQRGFPKKTYIFKIENMKGNPRAFAEDIGSKISENTIVDAYIKPFPVHETTIIQDFGISRARILLPAIHALEDELQVFDRFDGFFMFTEREKSTYLQTVIFIIANDTVLSETGHMKDNVKGTCTCYIVSNINLETIELRPITEFELISTIDLSTNK